MLFYKCVGVVVFRCMLVCCVVFVLGVVVLLFVFVVEDVVFVFVFVM